MTEKLFYSDSHLFSFPALVLSCEETEKGFLTELNRTAFFPEGGGQRADTGTIGPAQVRDVHEKNGRILHLTDRELTPGQEVFCLVDREQRLRRMQNHSGEHIVSGIVHGLFGFENVGFHMGSDCMTIDFSGELTREQLSDVEKRANEIVRANVEIRTFFPSDEEREKLEYRSKLELTENVRLVEIAGVDLCACCAPHVSRTGEVGLIKLLDCMRHRGGVRVSLVCGMDALDSINLQQKNITQISGLLSAKREETAEAVKKLLADQAARKEKAVLLSRENAALRAQLTSETEGNLCLFDEVLEEPALRELVNLLTEKCGGFAAVFSGSDTEGYRYVMGSRRVNLKANAKNINEGISGRGGGSPTMLQGSCSACAEDIQKFIIQYAPLN